MIFIIVLYISFFFNHVPWFSFNLFNANVKYNKSAECENECLKITFLICFDNIKKSGLTVGL